jgi:pimeloyl-ACP methyl ester carboxylesterase
MTRLPANGIALHVAEIAPAGPSYPDPPTAVLIHGMAGDSMASWYLTLAHPLAGTGMRVLLHDLRGHGRSDRPARGYALDHFVTDLESLLDEWGVTGPVHLFGNSFGGTIAFGYAARHPDRVAGIVAIESAPPTPAWFSRVGRRLGQAAALTDASDQGALFVRRLRDTQGLLRDTAFGAELPASRLPDPAAFAAVTCPVLCLYGGTSQVRELAGQTERLLPQTRTVVLADATHSLLLERTAEVREHVLTWLRDVQTLPACSTKGNTYG